MRVAVGPGNEHFISIRQVSSAKGPAEVSSSKLESCRR